MSNSRSDFASALRRDLTQFGTQIRYLIPEGRPLPPDIWQRRHRGIVILLWLHVLGLAAFGLLAGYGIIHTLAESGVIVVAAVGASLTQLSQRVRSVVASIGLLTASAILVHFSGGYIEMHFHFFVALVIIALYQDWLPFLVAIGYVVVEHGVFGTLAPQLVYNHQDGWMHPWKWASIHGAFVLAGSVASLINWRLAEAARARTELLLESAGEGICGVDRAGIITFVNPAAAGMVGRDVQGCIGQPFQAVYGPAETILPAERAGAAWPDRTQHLIESEFRRANGTSFPVEYIRRPIQEHGVTVGHVITFRDITERVYSAAERARLHEEHAQEQLRAQEVLIQTQTRALADLATPVIPVSEHIIVVPLIGALDAQRIQRVLDAVLHGIETHRSRIAILDITGVPLVDQVVAELLIHVVQAGRLLGTEVILTGIRPEVAQTLVGLAIDLQGIVTRSTLQAGMTDALYRRGSPGDLLADGKADDGR